MTFTLPSSTVADIGGQVTGNFTAVSPIVELLIGVVLAFIVVEFIIGVLSHHNEK